MEDNFAAYKTKIEEKWDANPDDFKDLDAKGAFDKSFDSVETCLLVTHEYIAFVKSSGDIRLSTAFQYHIRLSANFRHVTEITNDVLDGSSSKHLYSNIETYLTENWEEAEAGMALEDFSTQMEALDISEFTWRFRVDFNEAFEAWKKSVQH
jgi:hypothetical protein